MKKCAIYARVSTSDQRVDNQLYDLRLFAQQRGLEVVAEYTDVGISGSKARRPGLDAMLRDARKRKFSVLIVSAFDRVARSVKHFLTVASPNWKLTLLRSVSGPECAVARWTAFRAVDSRWTWITMLSLPTA